MTTKDDAPTTDVWDGKGGPAFPASAPTSVGGSVHYRGMTLRDWFAGQALAIIYARFELRADPQPEDLAIQAYIIADAMLSAREGGAA